LISFVDENNSYSEEASDYRWVSINDLKDKIKYTLKNLLNG